jgi:NitT/TauT family transport system substrate-binding protein
MGIYKYFIILIVLFVLSCKDSTQVLKVGTNVWPGYEPIYIAREKGFINTKFIKLIEFGSASQVLRSYRKNLINGAGLTLDEVIFLKSIGFNPKIILVADISNGADVLIVKPYIKTLKDLKGKKIGVENTALGAFFLTRILEKAGLTEKDIKVIPIEVNEHYKAFINGKVDGVITFEPIKTKLINVGGKVRLLQ